MRALPLILLLFGCNPAASSPDAPLGGAGAATESAPPPAHCSGWAATEAGARHRDLCEDGVAAIHVVEIDPRAWRIDAVRVVPTTAPALAAETSSPFAINANFFDTERKALGAVISNAETVQKAHPVSWQSIFYVTAEGTPAIVLPEEWENVRDSATMAVQAGPRLVAGGTKIDVNRATPSLRSGVCIAADRRPTFFATTGERLYDVHEIADLAIRSESEGGLGCHDAMLFDGGPSAQMHLEGAGIALAGDRVPVFVVAGPR